MAAGGGRRPVPRSWDAGRSDPHSRRVAVITRFAEGESSAAAVNPTIMSPPSHTTTVSFQIGGGRAPDADAKTAVAWRFVGRSRRRG